MQVHVKLFSRFRCHLPQEARGEATMELAGDAQIGQLLSRLGIAEHVKLLTVNGQPETDWAHVLQEGDTVKVFPVVVGG